MIILRWVVSLPVLPLLHVEFCENIIITLNKCDYRLAKYCFAYHSILIKVVENVYHAFGVREAHPQWYTPVELDNLIIYLSFKSLQIVTLLCTPFKAVPSKVPRVSKTSSDFLNRRHLYFILLICMIWAKSPGRNPLKFTRNHALRQRPYMIETIHSYTLPM